MKVTFAELNRGKPVIRRVTLSANIDAQLVPYAKYLGAENDRSLRLKSLLNRCWPGLWQVIECSSRRGGTGDLRGMEKRGLAGLRREPMASRKPRVRTVEPRWRD
jgi:hypothetical protein